MAISKKKVNYQELPFSITWRMVVFRKTVIVHVEKLNMSLCVRGIDQPI